jgi:hypothetical protein
MHTQTKQHSWLWRFAWRFARRFGFDYCRPGFLVFRGASPRLGLRPLLLALLALPFLLLADRDWRSSSSRRCRYRCW